MRVEGDYRPHVNEAAFNDGLPQAGNDQSGSAANPFDAIIQRQRLNLPDVNEYAKMWKGLTAVTINSPIAADVRIPVTPEIHHTILQVSRGIDFVLFDKLDVIQQASILGELQDHREGEGIELFELTYEEGLILRDAAAAVNVGYDPGTPEEMEKRTFTFSALEANAPPEALALRDWYAANNM